MHVPTTSGGKLLGKQAALCNTLIYNEAVHSCTLARIANVAHSSSTSLPPHRRASRPRPTRSGVIALDFADAARKSAT